MPQRLAILLLFTSLTCGLAATEANAQPPGPPETHELIVLLDIEANGGPPPQAVVNAVNAGSAIPAGLGAGNPSAARYGISRRATGLALERIEADPDSVEGRLQRYVVLTFPVNANIDGIMNGLQHDLYSGEAV